MKPPRFFVEAAKISSTKSSHPQFLENNNVNEHSATVYPYIKSTCTGCAHLIFYVTVQDGKIF